MVLNSDVFETRFDFRQTASRRKKKKLSVKRKRHIQLLAHDWTFLTVMTVRITMSRNNYGFDF